jgi:hypothetical protein
VRATNSCFTCWECNCPQQLADADPPYPSAHPRVRSSSLWKPAPIGHDEPTFEQLEAAS